MRGIAWLALIAFLGLSGAACGPDEYRPLAEDEAVVVRVYGYNVPIVRDGVEYLGEAEAFVRKVDVSSAFGVRDPGDGEYLPDRFVVSNGAEEAELACIWWHDSNPDDDLIAAKCRGYLKHAEPGSAIRARFNDLHGWEIVMPELSELTSPEPESVFSLGSGEDLVLSWEALGKDDMMRWSIGPVSFDEPGPCLDDVSWDDSSGEVDDTGSFIVPEGSYPTGLPAEGCQAFVRLSRGRDGTIDPAAPAGVMFGMQTYKMRMTLTP
ncbi:hypothetical protein WME95_29260 [Sorangium sp. So ce327]|uniref:hypothetical protein n=1 Tax=Sorangium sp. So ce327 TaxID=3133301 RepID=UPI003F5EC578